MLLQFLRCLCFCFLFLSAAGYIPRCCVQASRVPLSVLQEVEKFDVQNRHGACEIDAVVLHYMGKKICAKPRAKKVLLAIQQSKMGNQRMV